MSKHLTKEEFLAALREYGLVQLGEGVTIEGMGMDWSFPGDADTEPWIWRFAPRARAHYLTGCLGVCREERPAP